MSGTRNRPAFHLGCSECLRGSRLPTEGAKQIFQLNYHLVQLSRGGNELEPVSFQNHQENSAKTRAMLCLQEKVRFPQEKDSAGPGGPGPDEAGRAGTGQGELQSSHQSGGWRRIRRRSRCARASLPSLGRDCVAAAPRA